MNKRTERGIKSANNQDFKASDIQRQSDFFILQPFGGSKHYFYFTGKLVDI